jgi:hypothetical protein
MGSAAKIVLIGAASLVVGIYSVSLKKAQTSDLMTYACRVVQGPI